MMVITASPSEYLVSVFYERRPDGGMRVYSTDVPGFVLSHANPDLVFKDVIPALQVILSEMLGKTVRVTIPSRLQTDLKASSVVPLSDSGNIQYVAIAA